jgi:hypothetical protein
MALPKRWINVTTRVDVGSRKASCDGLVHIILPDCGAMMVWTCAVSSWDAAIQYRRGTGTDTTHWRVGTQGMTCSTRWAAVCGHAPPGTRTGQNPRRLQLKASSSLAGRCHSPAAESRARGCRTASSRTIRVPHRRVGLSRRIGVKGGEKGLQMVGDDADRAQSGSDRVAHTGW